MDWNEIWQRSHGDMLVQREDWGRESRQREQRQLGKKWNSAEISRENGWKDIKSAEKCWRYEERKFGREVLKIYW
jgi:hypothetical protein